ncbi:MAG: SufE family protein [Alphaproteobacteria bacterium]|nr:SufE family protein [Alphaproteobacteria bacterium]MBL0717704.1 SufE family protein [Alphaproteobacteria bacterium]
MTPLEILNLFSFGESGEEKLDILLSLSTELPSMKTEYLIESNKTKNCESDNHLCYNVEEKKYYADSNSMLVKGILYILLCYENFTFEENRDTRLSTIDTYISSTGLLEILSPQRLRGLEEFVKIIKSRAVSTETEYICRN